MLMFYCLEYFYLNISIGGKESLFENWVKMTVAYVVIRPVVALSALGAKIGFVLGRFIGTLVTNLEPVCAI